LDLYQGQDPRDLPAYTVWEAAHYLGLPPSTLRGWVRGYRSSRPVIHVGLERPTALSFTNLVEAHVLAAVRRKHNIPLDHVRTAVDNVRRRLKIDRPLAHAQFETDGVDLFVRDVGELVNVSQEGQLAMRDVLHTFLQRVERDEEGLAARLFPFTRSAAEPGAPKLIVMDPRVAFGRAVVVGTGIPTAVLAERYHAGDSLEQLAVDYRLELDKVEEAIRCELRRHAA
jgi:uncharacterized protein (DUF433 family)